MGVSDDPAVALGADRLGGAQMAQCLGDGGVVDPGRGGQIGHADRPGRLDAGQQREPGGIGQHGELPGAGVDRLGVRYGGNGLADALAVNNAVIGSFRGQQVHEGQCPTTAGLQLIV